MVRLRGVARFLDPFRTLFESSQPDLSKNATFGEDDVIPPPVCSKNLNIHFHTRDPDGGVGLLFGSDAESL